MTNERANHSWAVARKMVEIGKKKNLSEEEQEDLFVLGINHNIGYQFGDNDSPNIKGAEFLKENGYKYWKEVYYHGNPDSEYSSMYLDILNEADMKINNEGQEVSYEERLNDIADRYGRESAKYHNAERVISKLK